MIKTDIDIRFAGNDLTHKSGTIYGKYYVNATMSSCRLCRAGTALHRQT